MPRTADLVYESGYLKAGPKTWPALSGGGASKQIPNGWYKCHTFQNRIKKSMVREGVGFSVHLTPEVDNGRKELRIHPDGGELGKTAGCIGITGKISDCYSTLKAMLPDGTVKWLEVR